MARPHRTQEETIAVKTRNYRPRESGVYENELMQKQTQGKQVCNLSELYSRGLFITVTYTYMGSLCTADPYR